MLISVVADVKSFADNLNGHFLKVSKCCPLDKLYWGFLKNELCMHICYDHSCQLLLVIVKSLLFRI